MKQKSYQALVIPKNEDIGDNAFNAVRFLCCIIVILGHCIDISGIKVTYRAIIDMHVAVCVFFILSGFWVTKSFLIAPNIKKYTLKRVKRLLPLYYLTVFLFAILCGFYSDLGLAGYFSNPLLYKYLFWNSIFLNFMSPSLPGVFGNVPINGALWTIKVEISFYIVLPILIYLLKRFDSVKKRNAFLCGIYLLSVIWSHGLAYISNFIPIPSQLSYQLPGVMSYFVMGMVYLFNWDFLISKKNLFIVPAVIIFLLHYLTNTEIFMPATLSMILMWLGTTFTSLQRVGKPVDYSYGMYLFHFPLINIFTSVGLFTSLGIGGVICITSISFFMSFIAEKYIQPRFQ